MRNYKKIWGLEMANHVIPANLLFVFICLQPFSFSCFLNRLHLLKEIEFSGTMKHQQGSTHTGPPIKPSPILLQFHHQQMASADRSGETSTVHKPSNGLVMSNHQAPVLRTVCHKHDQLTGIKDQTKDSILEQSEPFLLVVFYPWCIPLKLKLKMCLKQDVWERLEMHLAAVEQP